MVNAYVLSFGGLLLLAGRATDLFGQRRMFIVGMVLFAVASLAGGLAQSAAMLIGARAVQGVGAAILASSGLAAMVATFPEGATALSVSGPAPPARAAPWVCSSAAC